MYVNQKQFYFIATHASKFSDVSYFNLLMVVYSGNNHGNEYRTQWGNAASIRYFGNREYLLFKTNYNDNNKNSNTSGNENNNNQLGMTSFILRLFYWF